MNRTVSWLFAAGVAIALSAICLAASLGWQHRAAAACEVDDPSPWCGMASNAVYTISLVAGLGFLVLAGLFWLYAVTARSRDPPPANA